jgi:hypothetical protein
MKKIYQIICALLFVSSVLSAQNFVWAKKMGGTNIDYGRSVAVDASGNVYTTGYFMSTNADFDPNAATVTLGTAGSFDIFISKLDAAGNYVWAKKVGNTLSDQGNGIAVDGSGNVYVTGIFRGSVDFDPGAGTFSLTGSTSGSAFILKLNSLGNFVWAVMPAGNSVSQGFGIVLDAGNVYTTGNFTGTGDFDPGASTVNMTSLGGTRDSYVSKLTSAGVFVWAKQMGGSAGDESGRAIALDASANVLTTGDFDGVADFDPSAATTNLTPVGAQDIYISKLDNSGNFVWAKMYGGFSGDFGMGIAADASGNVYTTGYFDGTADFDPGAATFNLTTASAQDAFVAKLSSAGNFVWAKQLASNAAGYGYGIALDASSNVYTTGYFYGTTDFDPGAGSFNITAFGSEDIYVSKLDASGNFVSASQLGGVDIDGGYAIAVDASSNIYTTG